MKNQKFEIRIAVGGNDKKVSVEVEMWKDGKLSDFRLLKGENLRLAFESLQYATGIAARLYLEQLHKEGRSPMNNIRSCERNDASEKCLNTGSNE